ncbi:MAG: hypothetical protein RSE00_01105 [Clostridia bacterium]
MKKTYVITFSISVIVLFAIALITLMLMLPQQVQVVTGTASDYSSIKKSEYTYEPTKQLNEDALVKDYNITNQDMDAYKNKSQYKPGNSDPFSPIGGSSGTGNTGGTANGTNGNTNNSSNSGSGATNSGTSGTTSSSTQDKTTNSNGGVANPPATNK